MMNLSVCLTCREGREDDPVVERLRYAVVVLQQHLVAIFRFAGVKYRLHLQQLQWRDEEKWGEQSPGSKLRTKSKFIDINLNNPVKFYL